MRIELVTFDPVCQAQEHQSQIAHIDASSIGEDIDNIMAEIKDFGNDSKFTRHNEPEPHLITQQDQEHGGR